MKKKKIMKQPSNITPLRWTTSMRKNKEIEKEKIENKSKNEKKKKKKKQKKHTNKKQLTIQNEERAKQTTYMAEQKEQTQYRG